jgi:UrcA family protein
MTLTTLAIAAIAATTSPAQPTRDVDAPVRHVTFDNAILATETGRQHVRRRISWTVDEVCGPVRTTGSLIASPEARTCRSHALADANRQLDIVLAAMANSRDLAAR